MSHTIYMAYTGMQSQANALEVISGNLANLQSSGFKQRQFFYELLDSLRDRSLTPLGEAINTPVVRSGEIIDFSGGHLDETGNPLDLALTGDGFFSVQTPQGVRYSRSGAFRIDSDGRLMTVDGLSVLGSERGGESPQPIVLPAGQVEVAANGQILVDGISAGTLRIVSFQDNRDLLTVGGSLFQAREGAIELPPGRLSVAQGFLEQSNVSAVSSMTEMVRIMRSFEMLSQAVRSISRDVDQKLINEVGRV
jgi:flagellar basal-body rod protein FlgF